MAAENLDGSVPGMRCRTFGTPGGTIVYWVSEAVRPEHPWLVFLPGLTADRRLFELQLEHFCGRASCLVWDPPAHGASRPFRLDFTMDDTAIWLHGILEAEGVARPVLVGQSMGGYVAQDFIDLFPVEAGGFVSIDSAPLKRRYYPAWELVALRHTKGIFQAIPWKLLKAWGATGAAETAYGRKIMRAFMDGYTKREYCDVVGFGYRLLADAIEAQRAYDIDCPAVLVCGERDRAGDVRSFNRKWSAGEGLELVWIEGAGHNANTDRPDEVNRIIEKCACVQA